MKSTTGLALLVAAVAVAAPAAASPHGGPPDDRPGAGRAPSGAARLLHIFRDNDRGDDFRNRGRWFNRFPGNSHGPRGHGWGYWNHGPGDDDHPMSP